MSSFIRFVTPACAALALSGCSIFQNTYAKPPFENTEVAPQETSVPVSNEANETSGEEVETSSAAATGELGQTVASLGDPTQPGFWLKTPLVETEQPGRVVRADGTTVQVVLRPLDASSGAGSEISLSAMRALGLSLTDLASLTIFGAAS